MRIVAGKFRGRNIEAPAGAATRPTSDRVRETMFNILAHGIEGFTFEGSRVLDLFAGTGALGFEALSRGASFCQFVDDSAGARGLIRRNAEALGVLGQVKVWRRDATRLGAAAPQPRFDLVFADPPYGNGLAAQAMASVVNGGWLDDEGLMVVEETNDAEVPDVAGLTLLDQRNYGDTQVRIYRAAKF